MCDDDIKVFWKQKEWVDKVVMRNLAEIFAVEKNRVHGKDAWVILFYYNLSAHIDQEAKTIFVNDKVLLFYPPT